MLDTAKFIHYCRKWREHRRLSQLDLALLADISQRHLSYLETGKSHPSREMITRLCDAMDIPLRERNQLYRAAGFNPKYNESSLQNADMLPIQDALERMLTHHDPYPAVVVDRFWNLVQQNQSANNLFGSVIKTLGDDQSCITDPLAPEKLNLAMLSLHPMGLRRFMLNRAEVSGQFLHRLKSEAMATADPDVYHHLNAIIEAAGPIESAPSSNTKALMPALAIELQLGEHVLKLFSVISTFGTPQDITTDEMRIEMFYPADTATKQFFGSAISK